MGVAGHLTNKADRTPRCANATSPSMPQDYHRTPLHVAARWGREEVVRLLLAAGATVDAKEKEGGLTPLMGAAADGKLRCVQLLLDAGADPLLKNVRGPPAHPTAPPRAAPHAGGGAGVRAWAPCRLRLHLRPPRSHEPRRTTTTRRGTTPK